MRAVRLLEYGEVVGVKRYTEAGIVEQIGSDAVACAPCRIRCHQRDGRVGGVCRCQAATIARKPSNLSFEEAVSVPVASQTAWQGIFTHGHSSPLFKVI